jgi:hypothetical protein
MTRIDPAAPSVTCTVCGVTLEDCALCERGDCEHAICYRCLRNRLGQSRDHARVRGG